MIVSLLALSIKSPLAFQFLACEHEKALTQGMLALVTLVQANNHEFVLTFSILGDNLPLYGVTIQMKPLQQYFHMALFIWYVILTFESVDKTIQMKPLQHYFHTVLCESYDVTMHSNETPLEELFHSTIFFSGLGLYELRNVLENFQFFVNCPLATISGRRDRFPVLVNFSFSVIMYGLFTSERTDSRLFVVVVVVQLKAILRISNRG